MHTLFPFPPCVGNTPIHIAVMAENAANLEVLIEVNDNIELNMKNNKGRTPLWLAVSGAKVTPAQ